MIHTNQNQRTEPTCHCWPKYEKTLTDLANHITEKHIMKCMICLTKFGKNLQLFSKLIQQYVESKKYFIAQVANATIDSVHEIKNDIKTFPSDILQTPSCLKDITSESSNDSDIVCQLDKGINSVIPVELPKAKIAPTKNSKVVFDLFGELSSSGDENDSEKFCIQKNYTSSLPSPPQNLQVLDMPIISTPKSENSNINASEEDILPNSPIKNESQECKQDKHIKRAKLIQLKSSPSPLYSEDDSYFEYRGSLPSLKTMNPMV